MKLLVFVISRLCIYTSVDPRSEEVAMLRRYAVGGLHASPKEGTLGGSCLEKVSGSERAGIDSSTKSSLHPPSG